MRIVYSEKVTLFQIYSLIITDKMISIRILRFQLRIEYLLCTKNGADYFNENIKKALSYIPQVKRKNVSHYHLKDIFANRLGNRVRP
jgi:hypothetical protein